MSVSLVGLMSSPVQAAKPKHSLSAEPGTTKSGQTFIYGKAATYPQKKVRIERKLKGGAYKIYKRAATDDAGKFRATVSGPSTACFRVVVPATKKYSQATKVVGCLE